MPKYLFKANYSVDGVKGLLKDGGTARRAIIDKMTADLGGSVEGFYYAFGDDDVYAIADLPDDETATAIALTVGGSGAVSISTTVLLTPEQVDAAAQKAVDYRPPGE